MDPQLAEKVHQLASGGEPFVLATVVETEGSASAKAGSKAIIDRNGGLVMGWIGGGCVESVARQEAVIALETGNSKLINVSLEDEFSEVGMPCGGKMTIYIEPHVPSSSLLVFGHGSIAEALAKLGDILGYHVTVCDPDATRDSYPTADEIWTDIDLTKLSMKPGTAAVVATQHKSDDKILKFLTDRKTSFISLVASKKRAAIVFDHIRSEGVPEMDIQAIRSPAGINIGSKTPEEIALSVLAEIVNWNRTGK